MDPILHLVTNRLRLRQDTQAAKVYLEKFTGGAWVTRAELNALTGDEGFLSYFIQDHEVKKQYLDTGAVDEYKIADYEVKTRHLDTGAVDEHKITGFSVKERHIDTGAVDFDKVHGKRGTRSAVPATATEIVHDLGVVPSFAWIQEVLGTVTAGVRLVDKTATSIRVQALTSGTDIEWMVLV